MSIGEAGAKFWDSGDEYFGQMNKDIEFGVGKYKIYEHSTEFTPDLVAYYAGKITNGEIGDLGVYTFPDGTVFAGEWLDQHPRFGYKEVFNKEREYDFYFGNFTEKVSKKGRLWIPHGEGVAICLRKRKLLCGNFEEGEFLTLTLNKNRVLHY
jgi:hypothetical protein